MRRRLATLTAVLAIVAAAPAGSVPTPAAAPPAQMAKTCSGSFVHAVMPWGHKCLRRGQFCKRFWNGRSADRLYHRYGYHCHGSGRLT